MHPPSHACHLRCDGYHRAMSMRKLLHLSWLFALMLPTQADPLSQADIEELRERLKTVRENASASMDKRFKIALDDFRAALQNDSAAMELYLKCVEKADFTDQQKKSQEFRDWKRDHEGRLKNAEFRQALRHQLNWLCLTMRASARPAEVAKLGPEVMQAMSDIFSNVTLIEGQHRVLAEDVQGTVFVRAYELGDLNTKEWPGSPLKIGEIYQTILMPPLRNPNKTKDLAEMWDKRIKMEIALVEYRENAEKPKGLVKQDQLTPALTKFREETLPQLQWEKQIDLYKAGDQKGAALRMYAHIEANIHNVKANDWVDEFQLLISPKPATPVIPPAPEQ